jgi:hypothetical protein
MVLRLPRLSPQSDLHIPNLELVFGKSNALATA